MSGLTAIKPTDLIVDNEPGLFLGYWPLSIGVQVTCVMNALVAIVIVAGASPVVYFHLGFFLVPPFVQIGLSALSLIGISIIVGALVGVSRRRVFPIEVYYYYVASLALVIAVLTLCIIFTGGECPALTQDPVTQRLGVNFNCGLVVAASVMGLLGLLAFTIYSAHIVWEFKEEVENSEENENQELLMQGTGKALAAAVQGLRSRPDASPMLPSIANWAVPVPGQQPQWGEVAIRTAVLSK